jgi:hypothetical protein
VLQVALPPQPWLWLQRRLQQRVCESRPELRRPGMCCTGSDLCRSCPDLRRPGAELRCGPELRRRPGVRLRQGLQQRLRQELLRPWLLPGSPLRLQQVLPRWLRDQPRLQQGLRLR